MDFHCSYEWLTEFVDVRLPPEELAERLSLHSVSVERVRRLDEGLDRVIVGSVARIAPHSNADKLRVVDVETRSGARSSRTRVVCGGTNLREGMLVAYAMPGAHVRWHGDGNVIELKSAEIRGIRSDGMICAASEIGLSVHFPAEQEREILDLSFLMEPMGGRSVPWAPRSRSPSPVVGQPIARALGLDDVVLDVEVTTNRPDVMSVIGLAREVSACTGARLRGDGVTRMSNPRPFDKAERGSGMRTSTFQIPDSSSQLRVRIADRRACPRYTATVLDGITVGSSPWWMQRRLIAAGMHPITNVVDVTNYVLIETGQPLHSFDAARLTRSSRLEIMIRRATARESLRALDSTTYVLRPDDLVIADAERPIAIAGVIGGTESGVTAATTSVVLEAATFDAMAVRKTWRHHSIRTESAIRYEKGLQPEAIEGARVRAIELLREIAGAPRIGKPIVVGQSFHPMRPIAFDCTRASAAIGIPIPRPEAKRVLAVLGCRITGTGARWRVTPPWWRRGDLAEPHDLVEELARMHGYHRLPSLLPTGTLPTAVRPSQLPQTPFDWEHRARATLAGFGATEIMTYSLTARATIERCGFTVDQCVAIENPLSEELALLRPSLLPTLLPIIARNEGETPKGLLFEFGNVYVPQAMEVALPRGRSKRQTKDSVRLPREELRLLFAAYGRMVSGGHVMQVKGIVERLFDRLGVRDVTFHPSGSCVLPSGTCLWHPGRTMDVIVHDTLVGVLGEVHPEIVERCGVHQRVAVAELDWAPILTTCGSTRAVTPPSAFPAVKRDLAIAVDRTTPYADLAVVLDRFDPLLTAFELFDTYEGAGVPLGKKSMAFHLAWSTPDRTLTAAEVDALLTRLTAYLRERFGAEVRE